MDKLVFIVVTFLHFPAIHCQEYASIKSYSGYRKLTPFIRNGSASLAREISAINPDDFLGLNSHSGFLTVKEIYGSEMFFWFFPAKIDLATTPWIIWLQGGPGFSSLFGLFEIIGPLTIKNGELKLRNITWAEDYSLLFIDNPVGAGFSFTQHDDGYPDNEDDVGEQLLELLQQFLEMFPELRIAPLFIAGESYAGKYVPALGIQIHRHNDVEQDINLRGIIIGSGLIDPISMMRYSELCSSLGLVDGAQATELRLLEELRRQGIIIGSGLIDPGSMMRYSELCSSLGLVDGAQATELQLLEEDAVNLLEEGRMVDAANKFNETIEYIKKQSKVSVYNFNRDPSNKAPELEHFVNTPEVRKAIGAGDVAFDFNNQEVYNKMLPDIMNSTKPFLEELLEHYGVICWHGQFDIITAYSLAINAYQALNWSRNYEYFTAPREYVTLNGKMSGYKKEGGNFIEVLVRDAGHVLPSDRPDVAIFLLRDFINKHK